MSTSEERRELLLTVMKELEQYLSGLSRENWEYPSACDRWTVADVVAHLIHTYHMYTTRVSRALEGNYTPDDLTPRANFGEVGATGDARRAEEAIKLRQELGDAMLSKYQESQRTLDLSLSQVGQGNWDKLAYRARGSEPIRNILDMCILETAVHSWDIRSKLAPDSRLSTEALPVIIERQPQRPTFNPRFADTSSPILRCRFEIAGLHQDTMDVVLTDERSYMELNSQAAAQVTFRSDAQTFVLLTYGRLKWDQALEDGRLFFDGDKQLVKDFFQRFPRE